ncbi:MAG: uroporphyrinogen decarboxylase [Deltaproteobacteria bacterium]|nr:MAG: uroporphyrinogen decarboxylase [Deltaproteobacteria bacterium]
MLDVLCGRQAERRPAWMMRQAGRYLPEYQATRAQAGSFLDLCYNPQLAAEVTLQPLRRFDLDAAILFADILLLPQALGVGVSFKAGEGPVVEKVASPEAVRLLRADRLGGSISKVYETVALVRANLGADKTLIGFCGAPWTVASYMIEGGSSEERLSARLAAWRQERWFEDLIEVLIESSVTYLSRQIEAGAEVVQIFDTWAIDLPGALRDRYCFEPIRRMRQELRSLHPHTPVIGFARGLGAGQADFVRVTGVDACGLESTVPLPFARDVLTPMCAVQGNLDPLALIAGGPVMRGEVLRIVESLPADRHVFNLGHGIRPETPISHVAEMIDIVRESDRCG